MTFTDATPADRASTAPSGVPSGVHSGERSADLAVIGGGIIGTMVARELAHRSPRARIVVLDRDTAGSGASRWKGARRWRKRRRLP